MEYPIGLYRSDRSHVSTYFWPYNEYYPHEPHMYLQSKPWSSDANISLLVLHLNCGPEVSKKVDIANVTAYTHQVFISKGL